MTGFAVKDVSLLPVVDPENPDEALGVLYRRDVIAADNEAIRTRPTE